MTKSIYVILHWIWWSLILGNSVLIGRDYIVGLENSSSLSNELWLHLFEKNIKVLSQAKDPGFGSPILDLWRTSESLGLTEHKAVEWNILINALRSTGITLKLGEDSLVWVWGNGSDVISTHNLYQALISPLNF